MMAESDPFFDFYDPYEHFEYIWFNIDIGGNLGDLNESYPGILFKVLLRS